MTIKQRGQSLEEFAAALRPGEVGTIPLENLTAAEHAMLLGTPEERLGRLLSSASDRDAAMEGVGLVDAKLTDLLATTMRAEMVSDLLGESGAIAAIDTRIALACGLGLLTGDDRITLSLLNRVRDRFIQNPKLLTFAEDGEVEGWLNSPALFSSREEFAIPSRLRLVMACQRAIHRMDLSLAGRPRGPLCIPPESMPVITHDQMARRVSNTGLSAPDMDAVVRAAESVRGANLRALATDEVQARVVALIKHARGGLGSYRDRTHVWHRGRSKAPEQGFDNIQDVLYRRQDVEMNRANFPGSSTFYASWNVSTVLEELRVRPGDVVHLVAARVEPPRTLPCYCVGDFSHVMNSGRSLVNDPNIEREVAQARFNLTREEFYCQWYIDAFLASEFKAERKNSYEYAATAAFAEFMARGRGGLMYPSVAQAGAINLAVPATVFDEYFEVLHTHVVRIKKVIEFGIYDVEWIRSSCDFAEDGAIRWNSDRRYSAFVGSTLRSEEIPTPDFRGWRVPSQ